MPQLTAKEIADLRAEIFAVRDKMFDHFSPYTEGELKVLSDYVTLLMSLQERLIVNSMDKHPVDPVRTHPHPE